MRWGVARRAFGAPLFSSSLRAVAIAALTLGAAGCASQPGAGLASFGQMPVASGATISFDSIDGPPPEVFRKLVATLNDEAQSRKVPVVARSAPASYRVRGYVSAMVDRGKTSFGWVWDIYDADKRRTLRISGEEPAAAGKRRDAWAAADDPLLRRMASKGMDRIAAFLNNSAEPPPPSAPEAPGIVLVTARDDSPEAAGIFRLFGAGETTGAAPAAEPAPEPAPQPKRGKPAKRTAAVR